MKNLIWIIVIVAIALLVFFFISPGEENGEELQEENMELMEEENMEAMEMPEGAKEVNTEISQVRWEGSKTLVANWVDSGTIGLKSGYVLEDENGAPTGGEVVIDMTTITSTKTGMGEETQTTNKLTGHLSSDDFFNVEMYPTSMFTITSVSVVEGEEGVYTVAGDLTIRDKTNPVEFQMTKTETGYSGSVDVDRTLYDVKFGSTKFFSGLGDGVVSDIFTIDFDLAL